MRLRWWRVVFLMLFGLLYSMQTCWADEGHRKFLDGVAAYRAGSYQQAVTAFKDLTNAGISNAKLFYNLGNAYLKVEDLGHAILWYERALKLDGDDPDLLFNLSYARSLTKDAQTGKTPSLYRILFFWKYQLSDQTILLCAIICNGLFWCLLIVRRLIKSKRRRLSAAAVVAAAPALIFVLTALYNFYDISHASSAVILPEKVSVRSGLSDHSTELFVLHAGTVVTVQKSQGDYVRISYSKDKIGWIRQSQAGTI